MAWPGLIWDRDAASRHVHVLDRSDIDEEDNITHDDWRLTP